nr:MAG TPA: hypothetical protein [Caudoviricetes sp.]
MPPLTVILPPGQREDKPPTTTKGDNPCPE